MSNPPTLSREPSFNEPPGILRDPVVLRARSWNTDIPNILPHERVFPIQIGSELFRLSGASLSSDAPSYFSQYFQCQLRRAEETGADPSSAIQTLYIDRDPGTFRDISLHLQGYHIRPRDGSHFVKMFADAQFYSLPRLVSQLYEESIFISIGHRSFQIPREVFAHPGDSPNYFSLGFAVFFSSPTEVFPGLNREGLLRPPSILPPSVPNRSADTFAELLKYLQGYPVRIIDERHRDELLRDCRYFHLKGLEQKLIRHSISFNLDRQRSEITISLEDIRQSGISVVGDAPVVSTPSPPSEPSTPSVSTNKNVGLVGYVNYARPFVDDKAHELILEIGSENTRLHFPSSNTGSFRAEFYGEGKKRISRLFEVIATKLNLPTSQPLGLLMKNGGASSQPPSPGNSGVSEDWVKCVMDEGCYVRLDGREYDMRTSRTVDVEREGSETLDERAKKRRRTEAGVDGIDGRGDREESWVIKTGQWRLRVRNVRNGTAKGGVECVLVGLRLDAFSGEYGRNSQRGFLGG